MDEANKARRKRFAFLFATLGTGVAGIATATTCYLLKDDEVPFAPSVPIPHQPVELHSTKTYSQLLPGFNNTKSMFQSSPGLSRDDNYFEATFGVALPHYEGLHYDHMIIASLTDNIHNKTQIKVSISYTNGNGFVAEVPFIIIPKDVVNSVVTHRTVYHVGSQSYATKQQAQQAVDAMVEASDIYKIDGIAQNFYTQADALEHLADKIIDTQVYNAGDITETGVNPFSVAGLTPVADIIPAYKYNNRLYENKLDAAKA